MTSQGARMVFAAELTTPILLLLPWILLLCGGVAKGRRPLSSAWLSMATGLLERRSHSPTRLYSPALSRTPTLPHTPNSSGTPARSRPPSSVAYVHSSNQMIEIQEVHFSCQEPSTENHTERLLNPKHDVIIRRGNTLILKLTMSLSLTCSYSVSLTFVPTFRPRERFGQFRAHGTANGSHDLWLSIVIPPNFPIGKYHTHIAISLKGRTETITHTNHKSVVVLFNPWNPDDDSYVETAETLESYMISDVGTIWRGTHRNKVPTKWEFGQYEEHCLDVALYLLRNLKADHCRSAAQVCRGLVAQVITRDSSGVLLASSNGAYTGGMHPLRWNGSPAILQKYYRSRSPVRYGVCWVFAGVCVTLLRALGLAARPVTCYNAAHYCTKLGQVDSHFSTEGDLVHELNRDQLWLYHVWCEVYMRRDDLVPGYDGWQVVDPTPQDKQCGQHRIGPAPVDAIRVGKNLHYDCEFIRSEVNADVRFLRVAKNHTMGTTRTLSVAQVSHSDVGVEVVCSDRHGEVVELTTSYKDPVKNDESNEKKSGGRFPSPMKDCVFDVEVSDGVALGDEVTVTITITNNGAMMRTVDGRLVGNVVQYTGQQVRRMLSMQFNGVISPRQSASVSLPVERKKYMRLLVDQCMLQFFVAVKVRESRQLFLKILPFQFALPHLEVVCPASVSVGEAFRVQIKFRNILTCSLSRVLFLVQAQSLCPQRELSHKRLVLPGGMVNVQLSMRAATVPGEYTVIANMSCDHLKDIRGSAVVTVTPQSTN